MNIGIVIPTMNRPKFLDRALLWYGHRGVPVYVGDSTLAGDTAAPLTLRHGYYCHTPGQNELQAAHSAALWSKEPFLAFAGDDDVMVPSTLMTLSTYLQYSPLHAVAGQCVLFTTRNGVVYGPLEATRAYEDSLFHLWKREELMEGLEFAMGLPSPDARGRALWSWLQRNGGGGLRRFEDVIHLFRQTHSGRVRSDADGSWRARLGQQWPRLQYSRQWVQSFTDPWSLPALRRAGSPDHGVFSEFERFITTVYKGKDSGVPVP